MERSICMVTQGGYGGECFQTQHWEGKVRASQARWQYDRYKEMLLKTEQKTCLNKIDSIKNETKMLEISKWTDMM